MKLQLDTASGGYAIRAYDATSISIGEERFTKSLIVSPERLIKAWGPENFELLDICHFDSLLEMKPEILLLGSGEKLRFPPPQLLGALGSHGIGVEVMGTAAACRTYNILMGDGRRVVAALLLI